MDEKLKLYNFDEVSRNWIRSYLSDRTRQVQVGTKVSDTIKGGNFSVPQGSVLGGLLHVINCNDLPACHEKGESVVFVDDDTDTVDGKDIAELKELIERESNNSAKWLNDNRLCVNVGKSRLLIAGSKNSKRSLEITSKTSISIEGEEVTESTSERLLGVTLKNDLTWRAHLCGDDQQPGLIQQLKQHVGLIKTLSKRVNKKSLKVFIDGIFYSKLVCNLPVFGNVFGLERYKETESRYTSFTKSDNNELQILQNKVNRILLNAKRTTSTAELCRRSNSLSIQQLIAYSTLTTTFKILASNKPSFLRSKFVRNGRDTAFIQSRRRGISKEGFVFRAIELANNAGDETMKAENIKDFKRKAIQWVRKNIEVKPRAKVKSSRFSQRVQMNNNGDEADTIVNMEVGQRLITDFFS